MEYKTKGKFGTQRWSGHGEGGNTLSLDIRLDDFYDKFEFSETFNYNLNYSDLKILKDLQDNYDVELTIKKKS